MDTNLPFQEEPWEELIGGKVVSMSPRPSVYHNFAASNIYSIFDRYLRGKACTPFADGTDLYLTDRDRFVPDCMIVCDPEKIRWNGVYGAPDLVVEVLSPGTAKNDRGIKKDRYEACGVREYWIVDPVNRSAEQYLLREGKFVLHDLCMVPPDYMQEKMALGEQPALRREFQCGLYDDLTVRLEDVFRRLP